MHSSTNPLETLSNIINDSRPPALSFNLFSRKKASQFILNLKAELNKEFDYRKEEKHLAAQNFSLTSIINFINLTSITSLTDADWHVLAKFFAEHQEYINALNSNLLPQVQQEVFVELTQQLKTFYLRKDERNFPEFPAHLADIFSQYDLIVLAKSYLDKFLDDAKTLDNSAEGIKIIYDDKLCEVIVCLQMYLGTNDFYQFIETLAKYILGLVNHPRLPCQQLQNLVNSLTTDQMISTYHLLPDLSDETQFGSDYMPLLEFLDAVAKTNKIINFGAGVTERICQNYIYFKNNSPQADSNNQANKFVRVIKYFSEPVSSETLDSLVTALLKVQTINVYTDDGDDVEHEEMEGSIPDFETLGVIFNRLTPQHKTQVALKYIESKSDMDLDDMDFDPAILQPYIGLENFMKFIDAVMRCSNLEDADDDANDLDSINELGFYLPMVPDTHKLMIIAQLFTKLEFTTEKIHRLAHEAIVLNLGIIKQLVPEGCIEKLISYVSRHGFPHLFRVRDWHQYVSDKKLFDGLLISAMKIYNRPDQNNFGYLAPFALITSKEKIPEVITFLCQKLKLTSSENDKKQIIRRISEFEKIPGQEMKLLVANSIKGFMKNRYEFNNYSNAFQGLLKIAFTLGSDSLQKKLATYLYSMLENPALTDIIRLEVFNINSDMLMAIYEKSKKENTRSIILKTFFSAIKVSGENNNPPFQADELDGLIPEQSKNEIKEACKYLMEQLAKPTPYLSRYYYYDCLMVYLPWMEKVDRMKLVTLLPNTDPIQKFIYLAAYQVDRRHAAVMEGATLPPVIADIVIAYDNHCQPAF
jgi:hypothetical protein